MVDKKEQLEQAFLVEDILPDASGFFEDSPEGLEAAIGDADIVLDTNVLLIPYGAGASSLTQITKVYSEIKERQRLCIPAQVSREFVKNRPSKLAQLHQGISDIISKLAPPGTLSYPILESVEHFKELNGLISKIGDLKNELNATASKVRSTIKNWGWNDPVSQAYRPIFTKNVIIAPKIDREKLLAEMLRRYEQAIPPGYKDSTKPDLGIGDFLIWKTILHLGQEHKRSVVFVSGDEKADWLHRSGGNGFLPRYELQAEFRRASKGHDLYIIPLSRLLELQKAAEDSVDEIRDEEERIREAVSVIATCPECMSEGLYELTEAVGSSALPSCYTCKEKFHLHRTRDGILVHKCNPPSKRKQDDDIEIVDCPTCGDPNIIMLGARVNSTAGCVCDWCGEKFPIHRRPDGSVSINTSADS